MTELIPLHMLPGGRSGRVHVLVGQTEQVHRLEEMGFRRGSSVEMLQPGSPCIVRIAGHKYCFRSDELLSVLVEPHAD